MALTIVLKKSACEKSQSYRKTSWSLIGLVVYGTRQKHYQVVIEA